MITTLKIKNFLKILKTALLAYAVIAPTVIIWFINQDKKEYDAIDKRQSDSLRILKHQIVREREIRAKEIEFIRKKNEKLQEDYNSIIVKRPKF